MTTPVFLTIDTEFAWRHHAAGLDCDAIYARSLEPAGVGLGYQLAELARHNLKACFFVDPMPAITFGPAPIRRMIDTILEAGQEVQLHLHPNWTSARAGDRGVAHDRFQLYTYSLAEQTDLLVRAHGIAGRGRRAAPDRVSRRELCRERRHADRARRPGLCL